jgi:probable O-glycosylation ligase (exosortase A-associated)
VFPEARASVRDIALTAFIFALVPFVLTRPHWGIYLWTWIGVMSPHKLCWSFARDFQFAVVAGVATLLAVFLFGREGRKMPWSPALVVLLLLNIWMLVTTFFALVPDDAWTQWEKVAKIQLFIFLTVYVMQERSRIMGLVWITALSIAYYGVKGAWYTIRGGTGHVLGPSGGFIETNTAIALALTISIPLLYYLQTQLRNRFLRWGMWGVMAACAIAVLGTHSRGGLVAIVAMAAFMWLKSRQKVWVGLVVALLVPAVGAIMPDRWFSRMETIETYEEDSSAMGRINAWHFAWNLAQDRPLTGGGFQTFTRNLFLQYAPDPLNFHDAHSIWFEMLGEQGFVGLGLFILFYLLGWREANKVIRLCRGRPDLAWARDLAAMMQVAMIGYFAGGSFLGLAYWDVPYSIVCFILLARVVVERELTPSAAAQKATAPAPGPIAPAPPPRLPA